MWNNKSSPTLKCNVLYKRHHWFHGHYHYQICDKDAKFKVLTLYFLARGSTCRRSQSLGYGVRRRRHVDGARHWTMIYKRPFRCNGYVSVADLYAHVGGRPLRIGVYRKNGAAYRLVQQVSFRRIRAGRNRVCHILHILLALNYH